MDNLTNNITEAIDIGLMDANDIEFKINDGGFVGLRYKGEEYRHITLRRSLPVVMPFEYISVADDKKKEIGIIRAIDELCAEQRHIVINELDTRYYCPVITEVTSVKDKLGYVYMEMRLRGTADTVYTKSCAVKDVNKNIRMLNEKDIIIFDVDGNRYLINDVDKLDKKSRRRLDPFLF
jgi:hypothetical protein